MLSKVFFLLLVSSARCFILEPFQPFLKSGEIEVTKSKISDCGDESSSFHVIEATLRPDPLLFPGNLSISVTTKVLRDLPDKDIMMKTTLKKTFPPITVPCVNNVGSCTYDFCKEFVSNPKVNETLCPKAGICGCPIKAKTYQIKNLESEGPELPGGALVEGDYNMNILVIDRKEKEKFGCLNMDFTIKRASKLVLQTNESN